MEDEIFDQVQTKLRARGRGYTSHYEPLKIAQEPFTTNVLAVELPKGFKGSCIDKYDKSIDLVDRATSYHDAMRQNWYSDAEQCRGFFGMLVDPARQYF